MERLLHVSSSPHVRDTVTTKNIMYDVLIAMIPAAAFGVYQFGFNALLVIILTMAACVLSEYIFEKAMKRPITIADGSALVTGMILALNMPPEIPVWVPALGGIFAIIVVKQLYGGLGQNFMNPALAARCFLLISFAGMMNNFSSARLGFDSVSGATPLASYACRRDGRPGSLVYRTDSRNHRRGIRSGSADRRSLHAGKESDQSQDPPYLYRHSSSVLILIRRL